MKLHRTVVASAGCVFAMISSGAALAATPFGLYVGAAGGRSDVRVDRSLTYTSSDISEHSTGWQAMIGIRPIQLLGAELDYVDFGDPSYRSGFINGTSRARAETLSGLVYAPLGVPHFDLYGKLGAARLQTSTHGLNTGQIFCPARNITNPDPDRGRRRAPAAHPRPLIPGARRRHEFPSGR